MSRKYVLYDGRAFYGPESASVLTVRDSDEEARQDAKDFGDAVCYSYEVRDDHLLDERFEWNSK